ncbi:hypothetical protein SLH46_12435 [Draconibacterium sp. IB214405]|uniref:hypothetical protein n=1 Tax=Draconibacterium sp. IB214405 TaxID=3097352 RepID=UPI002A0B34C7|nr:hypothetical protein [Draconibacterium sp. IB214405]MDX8339999.1 hypothetical protein [Draconibacterium sp. IB214405]
MKTESNNHDFKATTEADNLLEVLDLMNPVPDVLVEKVMQKTKEVDRAPDKSIDYSKYFQIAVVFVAAILIGVVMGKNANNVFAQKKQNTDKKALMELREIHHLSEKNSFGLF